MSPEISVIISFYNKIDYLKLVLAGYSRQTKQNFEVIIADDGSKKEVTDEIAKILNTYRFPMKHVWHEDIGFRKTTILNKAVVAAEGKYLIFTDQDCVPHSTYVQDHDELKSPGLMLGGRRVMLDQHTTNELNQQNVEHGYLEKTFLKQWIRQFSSDLEHAFWGIRVTNPFIRKFIKYKRKGIKGCNFSLFKADILIINGFDERYQKIDIGEDDCLNYRFLQAGFKVKILVNRFVQYHLYHAKVVRANPENVELFNSIKKAKMTYTPYGIIKEKMA